MVPLEQSPAARSLDVFVIKTLAAEAARKISPGRGGCIQVDLIAGQYTISVDKCGGRSMWAASQFDENGRGFLVAHSPLPLSE